MEKRKKEWICIGQRKTKIYIFYENKVFDLTEYLIIHPGGQKAIRNYMFKDVTSSLFTFYPHNKDTTMKVLEKYQIGTIPFCDMEEN